MPKLQLITRFRIDFGVAEDINLKPLNSIAEWLMDNPGINWLEEIRKASMTTYTQTFNY